MTTPFVNPNGQGLVVDRVGRNTRNIGNISNRAFIKGVGRSMINNVNSSQGTFGADVDVIESLNLKKNALRRVIVVASHSGDALNQSTASMAANLHLATSDNENLFDEVTQINIRPAGNVYNNGVTPQASQTFSVVRQYDSERKGTEVVLNSTIMGKLEQISHNLYNDTPLMSSRQGTMSKSMDEKRREEAADMAKSLHRLISTVMTEKKMELMLGIEQAVYDAVRRNGVDAALLQSSEELADSLIQAGFKGDVMQYLREQHTYDAFCADYCKRLVNQMFMLTKKPAEAVAWLNEVSDLFSRNLTSEKSYVDNMLVSAPGMGEAPVEKVLFVGEQTAHQIPGVTAGTRVGMMPINFYNNSKFYTNSNRTFVKLNESANQLDDLSPAFNDLLALKDDRNVNMDGTIMNLAPAAEKIFNLNADADEEVDLAAAESDKLYDVPVKDRCRVLPGKKGAIVLNVRSMNRMGPYGNEAPDHSRSGKTMSNLVMKASMGDIDLNNPQLFNWTDMVMSDKGFQNDARNLFGVGEINVKTETISTKTVKFGNQHVAFAMADPDLWTWQTRGLSNLNNFMSKMLKDNRSAFRSLHIYFQKLVKKFEVKEELVSKFYKFGSKEAATVLNSLEYSPFVDCTLNKPESKIEATRRAHFGDFPAWMIDGAYHTAFGNILAKDKTALAQIQTLLSDVKTVAAVTSETAGTSGVNLITILQELMAGAFSKADDLKTVVENRKNFIQSYVIAPVVIPGLNYSVDDESKLFPVGDGHAKFNPYAPKAPEGMSRVHMLNIARVAGDPNLTPLTKLFTLLGMLRKVNPQAMILNALARYPTGFAVDVVKLEKVYENPLMLATPKAVDVIVTPQPVVPQKRGTGDRSYKMNVRIQSVNNMAGGSCITIPNATPSVRADHVSTDFDDNPLICLDHISMGHYAYDTIGAILNKLKANKANDLTDADVQMMTSVLQDADEKRRQALSSRVRPGKTDSYQLFLRPAADLMKANELSAYMGVPRYCCLSGSYSNMPMVNFYSRNNSSNPWLSLLGGVYNQWYVNSAQIIRGSSGFVDGEGGVEQMETMTINPSQKNLSETTMLFLNAFDFSTFKESDLSPFQERLVEDHLNYRGGASVHKSREVAVVRGNPPAEDNYLHFAHTVARMGMAIPCTTYSNEGIRRLTREAKLPVKYDTTGFCVISPVSA